MARHLMLRRGGLSAYSQIAQILRGRVAAGDYRQDGRLPTEDQLMAEFNVSRHTVRAAVASLVDDGLVERLPGRGTFLLNRSEDGSSWRIRSLEDIIDQRFPEAPRLLETCNLVGRDDPEAAAALQLNPEEGMLRILAVRHIGQRPYTCSNLFVPRDIGDAIVEDLSQQMARRPLVRTIEAKCGVVANRALQTASAGPADAVVSTALEIPAASCVLMLLRTYYSTDGRPFEHVRLYGRPDLYTHTVEFSRQRG